MSVIEKDWQFDGNSANLIDLCKQALNEMENFVKARVPAQP